MTEEEKPVSADQEMENNEIVQPTVEPAKADVAEAPVAEPVIESEKPKEKMPLARMVGFAIVIITILAIIFYATRQPAAESTIKDGIGVKVSSSQEQGKVNIIEEVKSDILVSVGGSAQADSSKVKITAYLGNTQKNPNSVDCSLAYPIEREVEKNYDSNMVNTMIGLLEPLTAVEKEKGYFSAIPAGTVLKYLKLDDSGVMSVNLSGNIAQAAGSCAVTAIKSQIKQTISQFAAVKSVVICIDGNCDEDKILQP